MSGKHRQVGGPVISAGEPEFWNWCAVCQDSTRVRVPLKVNGLPRGGIEFCPGCGTGHDKPGVYVTPEPETAAGQGESATPARRGPLLPRLARAAHRKLCDRAGTIARECAYGDCPWPGFHRLAWSMPGDEGTWTYVFCRRAHRARWAAENGVIM